MNSNIDIRLGFACKIMSSDKSEDLNLKSLILKRVSPENMREIIQKNISAFEKQLYFLKKKNIHLFRICSDFIPFASSLYMPIDWEKEFAEELERVGKIAKQFNIRLSMHPGQYTILNSPNPPVVEASIRDYLYHCKLLDCLGLGKECKIITHIGGEYQNKQASIERFIRNYRLLPDIVKNRLTLENDDKIYCSSDVLEICNTLSCPFVLDLFHEKVNPSFISQESLLLEAKKTWKIDDGRQKIHYSQQAQGKHKGAHSETICKEDFLKIIQQIKNFQLDIMLEVKDKNISAQNCQAWLEEIKLLCN